MRAEVDLRRCRYGEAESGVDNRPLKPARRQQACSIRIATSPNNFGRLRATFQCRMASANPCGRRLKLLREHDRQGVGKILKGCFETRGIGGVVEFSAGHRSDRLRRRLIGILQKADAMHCDIRGFTISGRADRIPAGVPLAIGH